VHHGVSQAGRARYPCETKDSSGSSSPGLVAVVVVTRTPLRPPPPFRYVEPRVRLDEQPTSDLGDCPSADAAGLFGLVLHVFRTNSGDSWLPGKQVRNHVDEVIAANLGRCEAE
jgi:hypothetical protein